MKASHVIIAIYAILIFSLVIFCGATCVGFMIQMSYPWEAPAWLSWTVLGVKLNFLGLLLFAICQMTVWVFSRNQRDIAVSHDTELRR